MAKVHLFSNSLYAELFHHNIISSKGYITASDEDLKKYYDFLVEQAGDRTRDLIKERNATVKEVSRLLNEDNLNKSEAHKLEKLLQNLNLEFSDNGLLVSKEPEDVKPRYLGPPEPNETFWERQLIAREKRKKILKHDLGVLNKWLDELSGPSYKILRPTPSTIPEQKKIREKHYKERARKSHEAMSLARRNLIKTYHKKYEKDIGIKSRFDSRKHKTTKSTPSDAPSRDSTTSYYTAASHLSQTESDIQTDASFSQDQSDSSDQNQFFQENKAKASDKDVDKAHYRIL